MEVRTFEAHNMRDAVKQIKAELGQDAVILSTKEKSDTTSGAKIYEVKATQASSSRGNGASTGYSEMAAGNAKIDERFERMEARLNRIAENYAQRENIDHLENGLHELKLLLLESLRTKSGSTLSGLPSHLVEIERQLTLMNIDESIATALLKYLRDLPAPSETDVQGPEQLSEHYRNQAIRWMLKRISIAPRWSIIQGSTSVHCIVGTSGSGKTTATAKIANFLKTKEKAKVLLVSFDNQRVAAQEQLRVYARVMDIPFETMTEAKDLEVILRRHSDIDIVLIDTAGRSPKSPKYREELEAFKNLNTPVTTHLILPMSEKDTQLDRTIRYFSPLAIESLIFTKLDESWSYGEILNLASKWTLPLSYFSIGPRVPEDLERASRERVVERIFGI